MTHRGLGNASVSGQSFPVAKKYRENSFSVGTDPLFHEVSVLAEPFKSMSRDTISPAL